MAKTIDISASAKFHINVVDTDDGNFMLEIRPMSLIETLEPVVNVKMNRHNLFGLAVAAEAAIERSRKNG